MPGGGSDRGGAIGMVGFIIYTRCLNNSPQQQLSMVGLDFFILPTSVTFSAISEGKMTSDEQ